MADNSWPGTLEAFNQAAAWFVRVTAGVDGRLDDLGLGDWTVRDLVGHTSRSLLTVEAYLDQGQSTDSSISPVEYFRLSLGTVTDPAAVAQRGRDAGATLGADVATAVREIADRVVRLVAAADEDDLVATPVGDMRLADYMPTRTFELTVHTCDLATALGTAIEVPEAAAEASLTLLGGLAARAGLAAPLLLAATGRTALPAGFTVL